MTPEKLYSELNFCLKLWQEKNGCEFGGGKKCKDCATPYLLHKFISGKIIHKKMNLENWKSYYKKLKLKKE